MKKHIIYKDSFLMCYSASTQVHFHVGFNQIAASCIARQITIYQQKKLQMFTGYLYISQQVIKIKNKTKQFFTNCFLFSYSVAVILIQLSFIFFSVFSESLFGCCENKQISPINSSSLVHDASGISAGILKQINFCFKQQSGTS